MRTPSELAGDYFVATQQDRTTGTWGWEIHRRSTPLGIRLQGDGRATESAARLAGEKALKALLDGLAEEARNQSAD